MQWFYATKAGERLGVDEPELEALVRSGAVQPTTLLWNESLPDWRTAAEVRPELFAKTSGPVAPVGAVSRAALEPLIRRRGWLVVMAVGLGMYEVFRAWKEAPEAWGSFGQMAGVLIRLLAALVLVSSLATWAARLGTAGRTGSIEHARDACRSGGWVITFAGLVGGLLGLIILHDVVSRLAHMATKM